MIIIVFINIINCFYLQRITEVSGLISDFYCRERTRFHEVSDPTPLPLGNQPLAWLGASLSLECAPTRIVWIKTGVSGYVVYIIYDAIFV